MGILGLVKAWLVIKPIKTIRALKDKSMAPDLIHELEAQKDVEVIGEVGKGAWRHVLTGVGLLLVAGGVAEPEQVDGLVDSVLYLVTSWDQIVGSVMIVVGFGLSVVRKWRRRGE